MFRKLILAAVFGVLVSSVTLADEQLPHVGGVGADLRGHSFAMLDLTAADLRAADLRGVDFRGASLVGADLEGADLRGAQLQGADLRNANLRGTNLQNARLARTDLSGADLTLADLRNVDFFIEGGTVSLEAEAEGGRPRKSERVAPVAVASREFSVAGAVLDRALQSKPVCVYPPTSAVDMLHGFDRSRGLPLVADASGAAPTAFIEARTALLSRLACADKTGDVAPGLAAQADDNADSTPALAGFNVVVLMRQVFARDCPDGRTTADGPQAALMPAAGEEER